MPRCPDIWLNSILDFSVKSFWMRFIYFLKFIYFIYLFILAALGLHCCMQAFSSCSEQGLLFISVHGFLIVVGSLVAEHGL